MAVDMFLEFSSEINAQGASTDAIFGKRNAVNILAFSDGVHVTTSVGGTRPGVGKAQFEDLSITKYIDKTTPSLLKALAAGQHIARMKLYVRKAGANQPKPGPNLGAYLVYEFDDVLVTSSSWGGSGGEDQLTENLTFNFAKFAFTYYATSSDGSQQSAGSFSWDVNKNAAG